MSERSRFFADWRRFIFVSTALVVALVLAPLWTDRAGLRLLGEMYSLLTSALLWNLLAGYAGLLSVGQQAFVGIGGYTLFSSTIFLGISPYLAIPLGIVLAALAAAIFAPLLFRLEGAYFAIGSWVTAETVYLAFTMIPQLGGGAGMSLRAAVVLGIAEDRATREFIIYWLLLAAGASTLFGAYSLLRSKAGLALTALRDNPTAAASLGIDIWRAKFYTYVGVAAAVSAVSSLNFLQKLRIPPASGFSLNDWTVTIIFIVVIGGIGRLEGAIVGTAVYFILREFLANLGPIYMIVLGAIAIVTMIFARRGIWGLLEARFGWSLLPTIRLPPREDSA